MIRRLLATAAAAAALCIASALTGMPVHAQASTTAKSEPHVVSTRIGFVFGAGIDVGVSGIVTYAQGADGSLTKTAFTPVGGPVHSLALVHLRVGGLALYDLNGIGASYLYGFRVNPFTGALTRIKGTPVGPLSTGSLGLGAFDPLGHGLPGVPLLVAPACGLGGGIACPLSLGTFYINPSTGVLAKEVIGKITPGSKWVASQPLVANGLGSFAYTGFNNDTGATNLQTFLVKGAGATDHFSFYSTTLTDNGPSGPELQSSLSPLVITSSGLIEFEIGLFSSLPSTPPGIGLYTLTGARIDETQITGDISAIVQGNGLVYASETGSETSTDTSCRLTYFGPSALGVEGPYYAVPCYAPPNVVISMFAQAKYLYVGRYGLSSIGLKDLGFSGGGLAASTQGEVPHGAQMYSWAGFLLAKPAISVPAKVSLRVGIPVSITCSQQCSGTTSAKLTIAGSKSVVALGPTFVKPHAAGTFRVTIPFTARAHVVLAAALKSKKTVTIKTSATVTAGLNKTAVTLTSTLIP